MADFPIPKNQSLNIQRYDYRLTYGKTGRARYISHLDLMRTMQRAFKRAKIPIWYTQGFNPHAYLNFPLALSLGTDSKIEVLDVALIEELEFDEIVTRLNACMPEGLYIYNAAKPVNKHTEIALAEYEIRFDCNVSPEEAKQRFEHFVQRDKIEIEKRSKKKGVNLVDIKPHIKEVSVNVENNMTVINVILPAGCEFNLNTSAVMGAFCSLESIEIKNIYTTRTKIMCKNCEDFI
ncbi:MAG: TIGR03936 family radical SAM-associated protein [Ruminococcus sp.]|nr:TIGR03936 family radical SAM-associated protein [Ruminococcus sp.]